MKEFNVIEVQQQDGRFRKYAVFKDGSESRPIFIDEDGYEYFTVPNYINGDPELEKFNCKNFGFDKSYHRIYMHRHFDALETIRKGDGDIINSTPFFRYLNDAEVYYYLNRTYGEYLRNGFLKATSKYSKKYIAKYMKLCIHKKDENGSFKFDTIEEAISFTDIYIDKVLSYTEQFIGRKFDIEDTKFSDEISNIMKKENDDITLYFMLLHSMNAKDDGIIVYVDNDVRSFLKSSCAIEQFIDV